MEEIVLIGFGGHAKSVIDTIQSANKYKIAGYVENGKSQENYRGIKKLGEDKDLYNIFQQGIKNACIAIGYMGNSMVRNNIYNNMKSIGYEFPPIIDKSAVIAEDAITKEGAFIGKNAVLNANCSVGIMSIINTSSVIEHDCIVGDFSHISVGAVLCGQVIIGNNTFVGANATVLQQRKIGDFAIVGAGCVIKRDTENNCICSHHDDSLIKKYI